MFIAFKIEIKYRLIVASDFKVVIIITITARRMAYFIVRLVELPVCLIVKVIIVEVVGFVIRMQIQLLFIKE